MCMCTKAFVVCVLIWMHVYNILYMCVYFHGIWNNAYTYHVCAC